MSGDDDFEISLEQDDPDLYGLLLLANQKISNVGTTQVWIWGVAALGLCVGLHMKWFDQVFGADFSAVRGIGVYALICTTAFALFASLVSAQERWKYRSMRDEILMAMRRSNRTIYKLIAEIQSDDALSSIAEQIKDDKSIQVTSRADDAITR